MHLEGGKLSMDSRVKSQDLGNPCRVVVPPVNLGPVQGSQGAPGLAGKGSSEAIAPPLPSFERNLE